MEVETFLKGSPVMESGFTAQAELRAAEWAEGFVRAEEGRMASWWSTWNFRVPLRSPVR